ncbi:hypothetical protein [Stagnihabitans tardus]|uniref:Uncharacterized protein n=1 Tax=Stagnihabitans tardus TaxID=2699202 RepID=A0AAE4YGW4_9RHOB|nr:hypothetical protein [Stagnihabitans tardus]NBZ89924.1 hypothetical protein [Stagnihabitans tardus]
MPGAIIDVLGLQTFAPLGNEVPKDGKQTFPALPHDGSFAEANFLCHAALLRKSREGFIS